MRRVIYIGPYSTDVLNEKFGAATQVGAIRSKMLGVAKAIKYAGYESCIMTVLPSNINLNQFCKTEDEGISILVVSIRAGKLFRVLAMLKYIFFILQRTSRSDIFVFYNYFPEYIASALLLRIFRRSYFLDIEDGPRNDVSSLREIITKISFRIHIALRPRGYFSVSHELAQRLKLPDSLIIHGVSASSPPLPAQRAPRLEEQPFIVLYGGTLIGDTGLMLFLESLSILAQQSTVAFQFILTGYYDKEFVENSLRAASLPETISVVLMPLLRVDEYNAVLLRSGAALSLKLPNSAIGQTTFPSKLIEYGASSVPIISTRCANVEEVLSDETCFFLRETSADALAEQLIRVRNDPNLARRKADVARQRIIATTSIESVGIQIARHFNECL